MRISVPGIPQAILSAVSSAPQVSRSEAVERIAAFIKPGNVAVLTGAGVSVDSGIRAYRGHDGRYMNPNYKPILYHELIDKTAKGHAFRQRYWLRSYLGYPPVRDALPNPTHYAVAALQHANFISRLITQNVDGLHHKALVTKAHAHWPPPKLSSSILELHGTLHRVHCNRGHVVDRGTFQDWLSSANPSWFAYAQEMERMGTQPRTNPDGDVAVEHLGISYSDFQIPDCPACLLENHTNTVHKPQVVFFGESIPQSVKEASYDSIDSSDRLLVVGTTLATYSAFRLLKHALDTHKPVMLLNIGPTRADNITGVQKIEYPTGSVLHDVTRNVLGIRAVEDEIVREMLESGIVRPPKDTDDRAPRAAG
ncbi:DHS-like NAD/FAD-binding domain-containing protein [Macrolepiota fuliginosa MF-IS2]|uniref:DHS-like NAD/FAD-binding domain-containing protein n=1 Tax=Macrolepiota fuliginosa MF-IS2 TaxID=1400762 RepID=A0A9P5XMN3_9AGAR|nr:DHS-like NAD/FAD-binding domain-containing protein [Macrolepiota fuliginosa MF-IS2]